MESNMKKLTDDLKTPEPLSGYEGTLNQSGHALIGAFFYGVASFWYGGWWIAGAVTLVYLVVWEIGIQGWRGNDTLADTAFVGLGCAWFLVGEELGRVAYVSGIPFIFGCAVIVAYKFVR